MARRYLSFQSRLQSACERRQLVRIERSLETGWMNGFAMSMSDDLLMLALIADGVLLGGFVVVRLADLTTLRTPAPYAAFQKKALRIRGQTVPEPPDVDLSDFGKLLRTAGRAFPVVTIHREEVDPDVCHIGRVRSASRGKVRLQEIDPGARWAPLDRTESYPLAELTRVDFGGLYEDALSQVGGPPPN